MVKAIGALGGERVGGDLTPLGTADFSSYLIKAQATNPDVIVFLAQGDDMLNALKQAVQFGLDKQVHLAGAQQEMEPLEGLPPEARIGTWVLEWYWNQPGVPHVAEFVEATKKRTGRVPTARTWFGYVSTWTCAHAANTAKSLKAVKMAKSLQDLHLPPEVALGPNPAFYRAGQNQLLASLFVGEAQAKGSGAGRSLQGHRGRQGRRRRRHARGDRLQDDLAGLKRAMRRGGSAPLPPPPLKKRATIQAHVSSRPLQRVQRSDRRRLLCADGARPVAHPQPQRRHQFRPWRLPGARRLSRLTLIPYVGFWGALIIAPFLTAALGLVVERVLIRPLYGQRPALQPAR